MKIEITFLDGPTPQELKETKLTLIHNNWKVEGDLVMTTRLVEFMNRIHYASTDFHKRNKEANAAKRKNLEANVTKD